MMQIDLSIIIVSFNTKELTRACIESVIKNTNDITFEIIVVDNASNDGSIAAIKKLKNNINGNLRIVQNKKNDGFGKANNKGIKLAKGRFILFLNSDTVVHSNVLAEMVEWMDDEVTIGVATCALRNVDNSLQGTGGYFPTIPRVITWMTIQDLPFVDSVIKPFHPMKEKSASKGVGFYSKYQNLDWVTGAFLLTRKSILDKVGGFDEDYFMYTEEVDLCYRIKKKGWKVVYNPQWAITHYGGASGTKEQSILREFDGVKLFYKKHYSEWKLPVLRFLLKIGSLGRVIVFGILEGRKSAQVYLKAFVKV